MNKITKRESLVLFFKGFLMGSADVVPGVSGGTMALILGIYERLITSIRCINKKTLKLALTFKCKRFFEEVPWKFLSLVFAGILTAVFTLSRPIEWLLHNKASYVWAFFFGLVLASVIFVRSKIKKTTAFTYVLFLFGFIFAYSVAGLIPGTTPSTPIYIFLSGVVKIVVLCSFL